ncbi:MAG: 3-deoxy-manno-octulosonate cytidylyltransferase [Puniceicoccales bacterium]|jgi:3-deoxy-manno-octulosonate cytidylyltransferase (CMP-KDO synthetase)|nr:3-deoxy-manno-octulosonate cytidylyltransferase [Puniceicoccales bacterium]
MNVAIAIPARLASTRFPRKMLADLCGKPVIQRVYEVAKRANIANGICILTDSEEIRDVAVGFGATAIMTSPDCYCGTDRIASALEKISGDFIINIQGDEPLLDHKILVDMVARAETSSAEIITPIFKITDVADIDDVSLVKVVTRRDGNALYFSRSPIPFVRGVEKSKWLERCDIFGHVGVFGFRRSFLEKYRHLHRSDIELAESLEQLKFLDNGYSIDTIVASRPTIGIDTPEDLEKAIAYIGANAHKFG